MTSIVYNEQLHYWLHPVLTGLDHYQQPVRLQQHFHHPKGKGLSQHPTGTTTLVISINNNGIVAVGGTGTTTSVSNEFNLPQIDHFNIPPLTTLADGTGLLLWYGGTKSSWVQASGGTYNLVEKIDTIISTIQGQLPAKIIFTTTSTDQPNVSWTVPAGFNSVTIEASGAGALVTPAIATSTSGV